MKPGRDYEYLAELKARELVQRVGINFIPVDLNKYADSLGIDIQVVPLREEVSGRLFKDAGKWKIFVNSIHITPRQRFTVAHEISHLLLEEFTESAEREILARNLNQYSGKTKEEILCDISAAELLMPEKLFEPDVRKSDIGFDWIRKLADRYQSSLTSTGLRYAQYSPFPCALVIIEDKVVTYVKGSKRFKEDRSFIEIEKTVDSRTVAFDLFDDEPLEGSFGIAIDAWLETYYGKQEKIYEDSIFIAEFNQVLSLLWYLDEEYDDDTDDLELDGTLKFQRRYKRR